MGLMDSWLLGRSLLSKLKPRCVCSGISELGKQKCWLAQNDPSKPWKDFSSCACLFSCIVFSVVGLFFFMCEKGELSIAF